MREWSLRMRGEILSKNCFVCPCAVWKVLIRLLEFVQCYKKSDEIMMEWGCGQVYMSFIQNCMYHVANSERDNLSHLKPYQGASEHIW